jgi:small subunit ribosomal protein S1
MKQCHPNPWQKFSESFKKSEIVEGPITSITDFGIFVGLEGGIDGLIHMSDVTWEDDPNEIIKSYKKGDNIKASILQIDIERERISLGLKQMNSDPLESFIAVNPKGTILNGTIKDIDDKGATIKLSDDVDAYMKNSESSMDQKVKNISELFQIGDEVNGMINSIDKKNRSISFSVKQREKKDFEKVKSDLNKESSKGDANNGKTSLGALLKARLDDKKSVDETD